MTRSPAVVVYGAGAVGGYLGGLLAGAGTPVTLVARPPMVEVVSRQGLTLRGPAGETVVYPQAVPVAEGLKADLVLLTVRGYDVEGTIAAVEGLLTDRGKVVAFQNGVGTEESLVDALGRERVLVGTLTARVAIDSPGIVAQTSRSGGVALSSASQDSVPESVQQLFASVLPTIVVPNYRSLRWSKLLLNMVGAATSAVLDVGLAAVVADPSLFALERAAFLEATRVMRANAIPIVSLPGYPVPLAASAMRLLPPLARRVLGPRIVGARGDASPGMRADLARGRTEIASFNGAVVRAGRELGVPVPVNAALETIVRRLEHDPVERAAMRGDVPRFLTALQEEGAPVAMAVLPG